MVNNGTMATPEELTESDIRESSDQTLIDIINGTDVETERHTFLKIRVTTFE